MSRLLFIVPVLTLTACAHGPKLGAPQPNQVSVGVPTSCVPASLGPAPVYPDTDQALRSLDGPHRYITIAAGRKLRDQRLAEVEPALIACR